MARASIRNPDELYMSADVYGAEPGVCQENGPRRSVDRKCRHLGKASAHLNQIGRQRIKTMFQGLPPIIRVLDRSSVFKGCRRQGRAGKCNLPVLLVDDGGAHTGGADIYAEMEAQSEQPSDSARRYFSASQSMSSPTSCVVNVRGCQDFGTRAMMASTHSTVSRVAAGEPERM